MRHIEYLFLFLLSEKTGKGDGMQIPSWSENMDTKRYLNLANK